MSPERREQVETLFGRRLTIFSSEDPDHPTSRGGVAVVLNKNLVNTAAAKAVTIVPGRALLVHIPWHQQETLRLLAVYAPNVTESNGEQNAAFWKSIRTFFHKHPRTPRPAPAACPNTGRHYRRAPTPPNTPATSLNCITRRCRVRESIHTNELNASTTAASTNSSRRPKLHGE